MRSFRHRVFELLEAGQDHDTASLRCDLFLMTLISISVLAAVFESVPSIGSGYRSTFHGFEILCVAIFSFEYVVRLWCCVESSDPRFQHPILGRLRYARTGMALVDLFAILPFYAAAFVSIDLRFLRVLRILRILKLSHYFAALSILLDIVRTERHAFGAAFFLLTIGMLVASSGIYVFEHEQQPVAFGSIPAAMWWAVATLTTVGYGDVTPVTVAGKVFGASVTVMGIGMVALPAGILASGFNQAIARRKQTYGARYADAMADGILDASEQADLDVLRQDLGLSEEDVRRPCEALPVAVSARWEKCPHCGESLD